MLLRPRQKTFVERCLNALGSNGNTLSVAPTGAGKTIMFSEILGRLISGSELKAVVLAHRDELTAQNSAKFGEMFPSIPISLFDAKTKSWGGQVTFAMVPTLARDENLSTMPPMDFIVIDEAHHAVADTYQKIVAAALSRNPECRVLGVTATPNRSDNRGLREVFSNVADQITVGELIRSGHLVPPRTFIMDVGVKERLLKIDRQGGDFDMEAVEAILNQRPINRAVVDVWKEKARGRPTVVFCSTVAHATSVAEEFENGGVAAALVTGDLGNQDRSRELERFKNGDAEVIINVAVLTEGWDHPPTSCVVLLRPSSAKSTMIQMVGRGLRTVDARSYPGVHKSDCVVLDFGTSSIIHGTLEQDVLLDSPELDDTDPLMMECPSCKASIPLSSPACPICGHEFLREAAEGADEKSAPLTAVEMMEINLLDQSNFLWVDLFGDNASLMSTGFDAWAGLFLYEGAWFAVGGREKKSSVLLATGPRIVCLAAANDWLNQYETEDTVHKTRLWLGEPPTPKQIQVLPKEDKLDFNLTRYRASARITFNMKKVDIKTLICRN